MPSNPESLEKSSSGQMSVTLSRLSGQSYEVKNAAGASARIDGPPKLGGTDAGMRPMEMVLAALASCSAVDIVMILEQQKEPLDGLDIEVTGTRADAVPAVFTDIHLRVRMTGGVSERKAERAVKLSAEKYCSVARMLEPGVRITHELELAQPA